MRDDRNFNGRMRDKNASGKRDKFISTGEKQDSETENDGLLTVRISYPVPERGVI